MSILNVDKMREELGKLFSIVTWMSNLHKDAHLELILCKKCTHCRNLSVQEVGSI